MKKAVGFWVPAVAAAAAVLTGCAASARYVALQPAGGTVAIYRNTPEFRAKALELMAQKCPRGYNIVREEEFVVGTEISNETRHEYDRAFDESRTTQSVRSRENKEWRISFTCR